MLRIRYISNHGDGTVSIARGPLYAVRTYNITLASAIRLSLVLSSIPHMVSTGLYMCGWMAVMRGGYHEALLECRAQEIKLGGVKN